VKTGLFPQIAYLIDFVSEIAWLIQPFVFLLKCRIASNSDGCVLRGLSRLNEVDL
jgi:hypothetical protein